MGILYLFIKIYPVFGLLLGVLLIDFARNAKRKNNKAWIGMTLFASFFFITALIWLGFRGDKNADLWFNGMTAWFRND
jgi:hypothetical protein